jgi:hypothetical protein
MSNDTFLYSTPKPEKPLYGKCPATADLLMASYSIPVFWYMLFDKQSLKLGPTHDNPNIQYLHMTTPTADGLALAESRWPDVSRVLGASTESLFRVWVEFVRKKAKKYIHCETTEWYWMFDTHKKFEAELKLCLDAFTHIPKPRGKKRKLNKWWDKLLGQAHAGARGNRVETLGNLSYCGYGSHYSVPWGTEADDACGKLSEKLCKAPAFGKVPADILAYHHRWGGVHEFRVSKCKCGSEVFRLKYHQASAQRSCVSCGAEHFICEGEEWWNHYTPEEWKCKACGANVCNLGVAFYIDDNDWVSFMTIGQRCGKCGKIGCCVGIDCAGHDELYEQV